MAISIISIAKNSLKFSLVKVLSVFVGLGVSIYVARVLLPDEYGVYGFLSLWLTYASLVGPGISGAGSREMPVLFGRDRPKDAVAIQNVSVSSELLYTVVPFAVIMGASFFYSDSLLRTGLIVVAASYAASRLANLWSDMNFVRQRFNVVAGGSLIAAIVSPLITLATVHWLRVYALLIGSLLATIVVWAYYLKKGAIGYRFGLDRSEIVRLLKVGIILQMLTLIYWAFRLADKTIIASTLPLEQLGLYGFAASFVAYGLTLSADFGNVLQPVLWREAGKADSIQRGFRDTRRIAVYMALGAAAIIPIAQLAFYLIVSLIATNYIQSIPVFHILSYNIYLASIATVPNLILTSSIVNRQNLSVYVFAVGLALYIALDVLIIRLGYGVTGVAWVTIAIQGLVSVALYWLIKGYIFEDTAKFLRFLAKIFLPLLVVIPFYFLHGYVAISASNAWAFVGTSLTAQAVLWSLAIGIFYRDYLSSNELRAIGKEINLIVVKTKARLFMRKGSR